MHRWMGAVWLFCASSLLAQTLQLTTRPAKLTAQDLARGKQLFEAQCAPCHGIQGTGGKGANLAQPTLKHAADDAALFSVIREGIENTGMPGAWQMTEREVWLVVAHVRSLGRVATENLLGDPIKGKALFATHGCSGCHIVDGVGGDLGPELTEVGARRNAARLRQCLLEPGKALPDGFVVVRAVQQNGVELEGVRVNEDSFTVQIRDFANRFHSFRKQELRSLEYEPEATPMPGYRDKLSAPEIDDLIAYLANLRGHP